MQEYAGVCRIREYSQLGMQEYAQLGMQKLCREYAGVCLISLLHNTTGDDKLWWV